MRTDLVTQLPILKKKYLYFKNYAGQTINDIFDAEKLKTSIHRNIYELRSSVLINKGNGKFDLMPLPQEAQLAPIYALSLNDFDHDGKIDILTGGNLSRSKPEMGTYLASKGLLLRGTGKGNFTPMPAIQSAFKANGEMRDMLIIHHGNEQWLVASMNNENLKIFKF